MGAVDRNLRKALGQYAPLAKPSPALVTLTSGDGSVQVKRGSKGEQLLRRSGWKEAQ